MLSGFQRTASPKKRLRVKPAMTALYKENFMDYLHQFTFGIYPYLAMVIFLLGSLIRFEREQY